MRRMRFLLSGLLVLLTFACRLAPLTAEEILARTVVAMGQAQTYRADLTLTTRTPLLPATLNAQGVFVAPDQVYVSTDTLGATFEFLSLGADERYIRLAGTSRWIRLEVQSPRATPLSRLGQWRILSTARNLQLVSEDERLGDLPCYHLSMEVDLQALLDLTVPGLVETVAADAPPPRLDLWVSRGDFLIRRLESIMEFDLGGLGIPSQIHVIMDLSDYNEPVQLPRP